MKNNQEYSRKKIQFEFFFDNNNIQIKSKKANSITNYSKIDFKRELNQEQYNIVDNIVGPMLIIAGAGSGKTRTIVYAVTKLMLNGVDPSQIMLVTFTNKAANEMIERVRKILGWNPKNIWAGTFHSISNQFLRSYAKNLGLKPNYSIIDELDAIALMKLSIGSVNVDEFNDRLPTAKIAKKILSFSINCNKSIQEVIRWKYVQFDNDNIISKLNEIYKIYRVKKAKDNFVDFDDLLIFWNKLLDDRLIAQKIAQKIKYIFVDEYQDTNHIQAEIIFKLANQNPEKNIIAVGDDAQSIYAFRGANYQNIMQFPKKFKKTKILELTYNYRSIPEILELANESIKHNTSQYRKEMRTIREKSLKPQHIIVDNDEDQAQFITEQIIKMKSEGYKLNDIAILYRAGFHSLKIELELQRNAIPYIVRSGFSFFERSHIKDILAHLRIIQNPYDEIAWTRIFSYIPGIGKILTKRILEVILKEENPVGTVVQDDFFLNQLKGVKIPKIAKKNLITHVKKLHKFIPNDKPSDVILNLINIFEEKFKINYSNWQDRIEDLRELSKYSLNFDSIQYFLETLSLNYSNLDSKKILISSSNNKDEFLTLSTIHRAKGLEWKIVFIPMLSENLFPSSRVKDNIEAYEEERRVFYVAITRARDKLFLVSPLKVHSYSLNQALSISQFVSELNPKVYLEYFFKTESDKLKETYKINTKTNEIKQDKNASLFTTADNLLKK